MEIKFWGTRGSIASPGEDTVRYGGNTTCVEVLLTSGQRVILDAGSGIRVLGNSPPLKEGPTECYLLITHIHWDHIMGFPFFAPIYRKETKLLLDGCTKALEGLRITLNNGMVDGVFPVGYESLRSKIELLKRLPEGPLVVGDATVEATEIKHPQGGMGFRIKEGGKTMVFLTDNELSLDGSNGRSFSDYARFCEGADLLVHDAQYLPEEMKLKRGWGHSDYETVLILANSSGAKRLVFTHHDPDRTDTQIDQIILDARKKVRELGWDLVVDAAAEGMVISI